MARRADIDLLFGLLALQNGLIEQGALFSAFTTWAREKNRSMAEILVGEGRLDAGERALLEGLVKKHLERHGGDSGKSLSSISSIDSVREELSRIGDPDLQASLPPAPKPGPAEDDPFRTVASAGIGASTSHGSRFRTLRPHAAGGLGLVSVARDTELNRDVALKEIRERYADDPRHRSRFEFEAEITGGLEHPGIVPVYGLGRHADGRPYYAMRFIRGVTFKEAIVEFHAPDASRDPGRRRLELRKLLRSFLDICNTVEYAHQRGVVHRDLKPNNVMLGKHGETLVVDWGLAKALGRRASDTPIDERTLAPAVASGSSETLPGSAIGTPAYMSPEQAGGELDRIGPLSDVYSLGATLYTLLTGKPPFDDEDQGRMLQMVRQGKLTPPRKVDRSVDPALEAICLKAMAVSPSDRYASARDLADDVERWMADEPVAARSDPLSVRMARWVRRHRTLAAGLAVFLVVAVAGSSVAALLINDQRAQAVRNREQAEANLAIARRIVDQYAQFAGRLEDIPLMDDAQRTILEEARLFYEREALPQSRDSATRLAAARTQLRLAYIQQKLGRLKDARANAGRSLALYESLLQDDPAGLEQRQESVEALAALGRAEALAGDRQAASDHLRHAIDRGRELVESFPTEPKYRLGLGVARRELGDLLLSDHLLREAESAYRDALGLLEPLAAEHPKDEADIGALADAFDSMANLYTELNRDPESEGLRRRALAIRRTVLELSPADIGARCRLAWGLNNLGYTLDRRNSPAEAEAVFREAIARCEQIHGEHPDLPMNRIALSGALAHHAKLLAGASSDRALASYRRAVQVLPVGPLESYDFPGVRSRLGALYYDLALAERNLARLEESDNHLRQCIEICERFMRDQTHDRSFRILRGQAWLLLGMNLRDRGRIGEAVALFRRAAESHEGVLREIPGEPQVQGHHVEVLVEGLGKTYRYMKRTEEAEASYRRAADVLASMERKDPVDIYNLACCLAQCSALAGRARNPASAATPTGDADRAVDALRLAIDAGGCDLALVKGDTDLDPLRDRADFWALLKDLEFPADPFAH